MSEADDFIRPDCSYSLHGLEGAEVTCPECGAAVRRRDVLARRERSLMTLLRAPAWVLLLGIALALAMTAASIPYLFVTLACFGAVVAGIWISLVRLCVRRLGTRWAIGIVLGLHLMWLAQVGLLFGGLVLMAACIGGAPPSVFAPVAGLCIVLAGGALWLDSRVADALRRRDLRRRAILREQAGERATMRA